MVEAVLAVLFYLLGALILLRAFRGRLLFRFKFFYSYMAFSLVTGLAMLLVYVSVPSFYPTFFWVRFLATLIVEFAILIEISDHIFEPYPAIRRLGRFLNLAALTLFFLLYILPSLTAPSRSSHVIIELVKRSSITKAAIIVIILAAARFYRAPIGRNVGGLVNGLTIYLAINLVNFDLLERYGWASYGGIFRIAGPLSSVLALSAWTVSLWRYEAISPAALRGAGRGPEGMGPVGYQVERLNAALTRLLER